jgi:hypothetical protein
LRRFGVETKLRRFGVETSPTMLETYPTVPKPTTVLVTCCEVTPEPLPPLIGKLLSNKIPLLTIKLP